MSQFETLMAFVRETRELQQQYLETLRSENVSLIERYRSESLALIDKIEGRFEKSVDQLRDDIGDLKAETKGELKGVGQLYANTIIAILLTGFVGCGAIVLSIWLTAK